MIGTDDWVEGETGPRTYVLENVDPITKVVTPENLTGKDVELILTKQDGTIVDTSGDVLVTNAAAGEVMFGPDVLDMVAAKSPLNVRFKVSLDGVFKYFPKGKADVWTIRKR